MLSMNRFDIHTEIIPLSETGCFILMDRHKDSFSHPLHVHSEIELNFIEGAAGSRRTVGDSSEEIGDADLILIANPHLSHHWEKRPDNQEQIHEITIQFHPDFLEQKMLDRDQFTPIRDMLNEAHFGLSFSTETIRKIRPHLLELKKKTGFYAVLSLLQILFELSQATNVKKLASQKINALVDYPKNQRLSSILDYLNENYRHEVKLGDVSTMAGMSQVAFCRYFRKNTGKSLIDYLNDIRMGIAGKMLTNPNKAINEICYECGFNNLSNFNRCFKKKKGCTPSEYREDFLRTRQII